MHKKIQLSGIGTRTNYLPINEIPDSTSWSYMTIEPPGINANTLFKNILLEFYPDIQRGIDRTILRVSQLTDNVNCIRFHKNFSL